MINTIDLARQQDIARRYRAAHEFYTARQWHKAERQLRELLRRAGDVADVHALLGATLAAAGRPAEAVASFAAAIGLEPRVAARHRDAGRVLLGLQRFQEAAVCFFNALELGDGSDEVHFGLALGLEGSGLTITRGDGRVIDAEAAREAGLKAHPGHQGLHERRLAHWAAQADFARAEPVATRLVILDPAQEDAWRILALARFFDGDGETARGLITRTIHLGGRDADRIRRIMMFDIFPEDGAAIDAIRARMARDIADLAGAGLSIGDPCRHISLTNFFLAYHAREDRDLQRALGDLVRRAAPVLTFTAPHVGARRRPGKWRIGLVSSYFRRHTIANLNAGLVQHLDRDRFTLILIRPVGREDSVTMAFKAGTNAELVVPADLAVAQKAIADLELDILYFCDIGMEPFTSYLAYARLAPVQVTTWGHPVTSGLSTIDYFISARDMEPPGAEASYTERLLVTDKVSTCYFAPELAYNEIDKVALGLPADKRLYLCPQTLFKFHPDFDRAIARILRGDPDGVLVLIRFSRYMEGRLTARILRKHPDLAGRILFIPPQQREHFLHLMKVADVVLDTPQFSGGNSTFEAFALGVPVVAWPSDQARGRITYALYRQAGIQDCIAAGEDAYVAIAHRLAQDPDWRESLKGRLIVAAPRLFQQVDVVAQIADFLDKAARDAESP